MAGIHGVLGRPSKAQRLARLAEHRIEQAVSDLQESALLDFEAGQTASSRGQVLADAAARAYEEAADLAASARATERRAEAISSLLA